MTSSTILSTWNEMALLDLVTIKSGQVDPRAPAYRNLPLIAPDHLASQTGRLLKKESAAAQGAISGKYLVKPGDVIYSKIRPYLQKAYKCDFDALCSADMYPFTPRPGVDASFVLHTILGSDFTNFATSVSARSGIPKINRAELSEYRLTVPPSREQRAIGRALDDVDDLIAALERMIAKKQAIKHGVMQQLLTGTTRLPGFTERWELRRLGDLLAYEQPGRYLVSSTEYGDVGTPVLTAGKTFVLGRTTERHGIYYSVPVIIFDDFTTASKFVTFPFKAKSSAMKILSARSGVNLHYMYERMQLIDYPVVDHKRRWIAEYSKIEVEVPDDAEQRAIASVIDDAGAEVNALEVRIAKARAIKAGMMQELLTGSTRLPVEAAS
ncbi:MULTISPECIES: restriction endonuclease subunit S [Micromonospora]|uniref:Restriction endonuclease subunit S n=1 Tax=Micromonospora chalcea TaxID=1874 RepID=A0ABX9XZ99_MICCH|nr:MULTISPECIES: restriction endonuclease subunit S [Micromonospora]RQW90038.1 restriction endonuclease subunit S [Micromonospora chalcea]RQX12478.1 restriction endonuclease subunit S [Micromonospora chalcea]